MCQSTSILFTLYIVFLRKEWLKRVCASLSLSLSLSLLLCTKTDFVHRWSFYMYMVTCLFVSLCNHICAFSISVIPLFLFVVVKITQSHERVRGRARREPSLRWSKKRRSFTGQTSGMPSLSAPQKRRVVAQSRHSNRRSRRSCSRASWRYVTAIARRRNGSGVTTIFT